MSKKQQGREVLVMPNFSFDLFGFDWLTQDDIVGFWIGSFKNWETDGQRSLLSIHYDQGLIRIDILFIRVITKVINYGYSEEEE